MTRKRGAASPSRHPLSGQKRLLAEIDHNYRRSLSLASPPTRERKPGQCWYREWCENPSTDDSKFCANHEIEMQAGPHAPQTRSKHDLD